MFCTKRKKSVSCLDRYKARDGLSGLCKSAAGAARSIGEVLGKYISKVPWEKGNMRDTGDLISVTI
jgi:hypothetical protein